MLGNFDDHTNLQTIMRRLVFLYSFTLLFQLPSKSLFAQPSIPVDPLTGQAQLSIPFWQLEYGALTVPIGIAYDSRGVRVEDTEGLAGMNWSLYGGGSVSRQLRGIPDDYFSNGFDPSDNRKGWLYGTNAQTISGYTVTSNDSPSDCGDEVGDWNFLTNLGYTTDTEPDIFSFTAPGLSGQFVFGVDKFPKLIPYQDVKISFTPAAVDQPITAIIITRNDGTKYYFNSNEKTKRKVSYYRPNTITQFIRWKELYKKEIEYTSAWYLTKIEGANGEVINYTYTAGKVGSSTKPVEIINTAGAVDKHYKLVDYVTSRKITSIESAATRVSFEYLYGETLLTRVTVLDRAQNTQKEFVLSYKFASSSQSKRGFLVDIKEQNSLCNSFPAYKFDYYNLTIGANGVNTISIPFQDSVQQDLWGYFNNSGVNKKPTIYYYATKTNAERYRYYAIPGLTATATISGGSNRAVDPLKVYYGALQKVTYPTGGSIKLTYEPNAYHDAEANQTNYGPGLRVKQVAIQDSVGIAPNTVIDYEYKTWDNKSSGKWVHRSVYGYHDVSNFYAIRSDESPDARILYEFATIKQAGKGKTIYEYILPGMYPLTTQAGYSDWAAPKIKVARSTSTNCTPMGNLQVAYYLHPFVPNTTYDFERGLLNKVSDYTETGQLIHEKIFSYQRLGTPSVVVNGIRYEFLKNTSNLLTGASTNANIFVFSKYPILANLGKVVLTETERTADMTDVTKFWETSTTYSFSTTHYMLQYLSTVGSDGVTNKKKFRYAKDFSNITSPSSSDTVAQAIKKLNDDNRQGTLIETINSINNGTETYTSASLSLFKFFGTQTLPKEVRVFNGTTAFTEASVNPASGANQTFLCPSYRPSTFIENYDSIGNPLTIRDLSKSKKSFHYGYKKTKPVADISNASSDQVVYAGFENYSGGEFNTGPAGTSSNVWSGKKAAPVTSSTVFERTIVKKGLGNSYRFSAYIFSSTAVQLTFKIFNGSTQLTSGTLSYSAGDVNKWKYLEGKLTYAGLPATFKLKVESNGSATVDDILFYPESASINTFTYEPLYGKTSETDTRGVSTFYEYDNLGRLKNTKDQDKVLRQTNDYYYKVQPYPSLSASFSADKQPYQVVLGTTVNYTAPANCLSPVIYDWYVNDVKLGSNTVNFSYTFSAKQKYTVKLVALYNSLGITSEQAVNYDITVSGTGPIGVTVMDNDGTNTYSYCNGPHTKTFAAALSGCYIKADVEFSWFYNKGTGWLPADANCVINDTPGGQTMTFNALTAFNGLSNLAAYSIKCVVTTTCPVDGVTSTAEHERSITYNGNTNCQ